MNLQKIHRLFCWSVLLNRSTKKERCRSARMIISPNPFSQFANWSAKSTNFSRPEIQIKAEVDMFAETLEMKKTPYQETEFGDPGMDDEMIQTNQIGSIPADETAKYQTSVNFQNDEPDDTAKTQPLARKILRTFTRPNKLRKVRCRPSMN